MVRAAEGKKPFLFNMPEALYIEFTDAVAMANMGKKVNERISKTSLLVEFIRYWIASRKANACEQAIPQRIRGQKVMVRHGVPRDGGGEVVKPPHGMTIEQMDEVLDPDRRTYREND